MSVCLLASFAVLTLADGPAVDLGLVDRKPPTKDDLKVPKSDDGVPKVGLKSDVKGSAAKDEKRTVYVLVSPVSNRELAGTWWVQAEVARADAKFEGDAQFGEEDGGAGEFFAVVAVATDKKWEPGEKLTELPKDAAYSKATTVKRTK